MQHLAPAADPRTARRVLVRALLLLLSAAPSAAQDTFRVLVDVSSHGEAAYDARISADGSVASYLITNSFNVDGVVVDASTGERLTTFCCAGGESESSSTPVLSQGGSVAMAAVGSEGTTFTMRWENGTRQVIAQGDGFSAPSVSVGALSADGSRFAGRLFDSGAGAESYLATWDGSSASFTALPGLPSPTAMSGDGGVVVGNARSNGAREAFRWTAATGTVGLGDLDGGGVESVAFDISLDGSTIVGSGDSGVSEAVYWNVMLEMVPLGLPSGVDSSRALGVSADGSVIVGQAFPGAGGSRAFIWDEAHGMRFLDELLLALGADLMGVDLQTAHDISADGRTIVGLGDSGAGFGGDIVWVATLPEPSTASLLALGLIGLGARRAARRS